MSETKVEDHSKPPTATREQMHQRQDFSCPWQEALLSHSPVSSTTTLYTGSQARFFFLGTLDNEMNTLVHWKWLYYQAHPVTVLGVCVCPCACMCACRCICTCVIYMWKPEVNLRWHSLCYWDRVTLTWSLPSRPGRLASKHQESACPWLTIIKTSVLPCPAFLIWVLESELMSSWMYISTQWTDLFPQLESAQ